jgi:hypothetical protein
VRYWLLTAILLLPSSLFAGQQFRGPHAAILSSTQAVAQASGGGGGGGEGGPIAASSTDTTPSPLNEFIPNVTFYVNPMSADGGNGTTISIDSADPNRAFKYLKHAEAMNRNLVTGSENVIIICHSTRTASDPYSQTQDTPTVSWSGWTTDSTHRVRITASNFSLHNGSIPEHGYIYTPTDYGNAISWSDGNIIWDHMTIVSSGTSTSAFPAMFNIGAMEANTTGYFLNNIIGGRLEGDENASYMVAGSNANVKTVILANNIFVGLNASRKGLDTGYSGFFRGLAVSNANNTVYAFNNHWSNMYLTTEISAGTVVLINNTSQNANSTAYSGCSSGSDRNLSEDASTCGQDPVASTTVLYEGESVLNFRLSNTDTAAYKQGVSMSTSTVFAFNYDMDNGTRTVNTGRQVWDLGPDERGTNRKTLGGLW